MDVKIPTVPIHISTSALTELAWILGGFMVGEGEEQEEGHGEVGLMDESEVGAMGGQNKSGSVGTSSNSNSSSSRRRRMRSGRLGRAKAAASPSPLMPVKVIYRKPSKVRASSMKAARNSAYPPPPHPRIGSYYTSL